MYITQQLKNNKDKKRSEKRVSSILINKKMFVDTLDTILENPNDDHSFKQDLNKPQPSFTLKRYHSQGIAMSNAVSNLHVQKKLDKFRITKRNKMSKKNGKIKTEWNNEKDKNCKMVQSSGENQLNRMRRNIKLPAFKQQKNLENWGSQKGEGIDLQQQNINKLNSFIRGAYFTENQEYSDFVNLSMLQRYRQDFYIFSNLYQKTAESNMMNKLSIKDVKSQTLRDVVCLNEHKDQVTSSELKKILRKLNIVQ